MMNQSCEWNTILSFLELSDISSLLAVCHDFSSRFDWNTSYGHQRIWEGMIRIWNSKRFLNQLPKKKEAILTSLIGYKAEKEFWQNQWKNPRKFTLLGIKNSIDLSFFMTDYNFPSLAFSFLIPLRKIWNEWKTEKKWSQYPDLVLTEKMFNVKGREIGLVVTYTHPNVLQQQDKKEKNELSIHWIEDDIDCLKLTRHAQNDSLVACSNHRTDWKEALKVRGNFFFFDQQYRTYKLDLEGNYILKHTVWGNFAISDHHDDHHDQFQKLCIDRDELSTCSFKVPIGLFSFPPVGCMRNQRIYYALFFVDCFLIVRKETTSKLFEPCTPTYSFIADLDPFHMQDLAYLEINSEETWFSLHFPTFTIFETICSENEILTNELFTILHTPQILFHQCFLTTSKASTGLCYFDKDSKLFTRLDLQIKENIRGQKLITTMKYDYQIRKKSIQFFNKAIKYFVEVNENTLFLYGIFVSMKTKTTQFRCLVESLNRALSTLWKYTFPSEFKIDVMIPLIHHSPNTAERFFLFRERYGIVFIGILNLWKFA